MKIAKILGITAAVAAVAYLTKGMWMPKKLIPNPATGENIPPRTRGDGARDTTPANFAGKIRSDYGSVAFNADFADQYPNGNAMDGFDMMTGRSIFSFKKSPTVVTNANGKWIVKGDWKGGTFGCPSGQSKIWNGVKWVCAVRSGPNA